MLLNISITYIIFIKIITNYNNVKLKTEMPYIKQQRDIFIIKLKFNYNNNKLL